VADLAVSPDGSAVFVTGYTLSGGWDLATVAYRMSNGREIWASRYHPGGTNNYANALTVSPDGASVFVTGTGPANGYLDYVTVAYDASNGDQRWVERYDGPAGEEDDAVALAMAPDGTSVFVTGYSDGSGTYEDYATIAYDPSTGDQRWVERYDGPARFPDFALAIAVSPDGSVVFVTGRSWSGTNYDYATVAYSSG
jgi:dipeptidyl aminopeptidase/acylaminoacyl peptidase